MKPIIEITQEQWDNFINNSCIRSEVHTENKDFMRGYIKGIQVALLDLVGMEHREAVARLEERLRPYRENAEG